MWARRWTEQELADHLALQKRHHERMAQNESQRLTAKPPKYRNRKVTDAEGNVHDSTKEFRNWQALQLREKAGEISNLRRHVRFDFCFNGVFIGFYTADATYNENGNLVVEDTKSEATRKIRDYPLRRNLMRACHNITIREV